MTVSRESEPLPHHTLRPKTSQSRSAARRQRFLLHVQINIPIRTVPTHQIYQYVRYQHTKYTNTYGTNTPNIPIRTVPTHQIYQYVRYQHTKYTNTYGSNTPNIPPFTHFTDFPNFKAFAHFWRAHVSFPSHFQLLPLTPVTSVSIPNTYASTYYCTYFIMGVKLHGAARSNGLTTRYKAPLYPNICQHLSPCHNTHHQYTCFDSLLRCLLHGGTKGLTTRYKGQGGI